MLHSAVRVPGAPSRKRGDWEWDFNHLKMVFSFFTNTEYCVLSWIIDYNPWFWKESFVFTCLTYKNVQHFRNGPVYKFYGLKASQLMTKFVLVLMNTHTLKKCKRIFVKRISKVRQTTSNWIVRIVNEATSVVTWYLSLSLVWNILILLFVFVVFNAARRGLYCNAKPESLFL